MQTTADSPYAFLAQFDTVFLIDDSGSMAGRSWRETAAALAAITPICTAHDADGIDIFFLNHRNSQNPTGGYTNITTTVGVESIFNSIRPLGGTPTGTRLQHILRPYLARVEESIERQAHGQEVTVKPVNIIVITDGVPSDDVEAVIVQAAKKLDAWFAEPWQAGIQFFQVGREPEAAEDLRELDDGLSSRHDIRDMVDTIPWTGDEGQVLTAEGLLKAVLGSVHKKLDRRRGSDDRLRR
jgi:von Willebrand factor type A domain